MRKEIGGLFELDPTVLANTRKTVVPLCASFNSENMVLLDCGRSALYFLIDRVLAIKDNEQVLLPSYLCYAMIQPFKDRGIAYDFFRVDSRLNVDLEHLKSKVNDQTRALLFVQYFGFPLNGETVDYLQYLKSRGLLLIEDITHSAFSRNPRLYGFGSYIFGSLRKWFALPEGGILVNKEGVYSDLHMEAGYSEFSFKFTLSQLLKASYLHAQDPALRNSYNKLLLEAMASLDRRRGAREATSFSRQIFDTYDYESLIEIRPQNYRHLLEGLAGLEQVEILFPELPDDVIPLHLPVIVNPAIRNRLQSFLEAEGIFTFSHWILPEEIDKNEYPGAHKLSDSIISLVVDQRYGPAEMKYTAEKIRDYFR